jgi:hypothetical protein
LQDILYFQDAATNVISKPSFKRKEAQCHFGATQRLITAQYRELTYPPEIDEIPKFFVVNEPTDTPLPLCYETLHTYHGPAN